MKYYFVTAGNQLSDKDAQRIGEALKNNLSLNTLDLSYNNFGEDGGIHLAAGMVAIYRFFSAQFYSI